MKCCSQLFLTLLVSKCVCGNTFVEVLCSFATQVSLLGLVKAGSALWFSGALGVPCLLTSISKIPRPPYGSHPINIIQSTGTAISASYIISYSTSSVCYTHFIYPHHPFLRNHPNLKNPALANLPPSNFFFFRRNSTNQSTIKPKHPLGQLNKTS